MCNLLRFIASDDAFLGQIVEALVVERAQSQQVASVQSAGSSTVLGLRLNLEMARLRCACWSNVVCEGELDSRVEVFCLSGFFLASEFERCCAYEKRGLHKERGQRKVAAA